MPSSSDILSSNSSSDSYGEVVKENVLAVSPLRLRWLTAGALASVAAALALLAAGERLPEPAARGAPPDTFIAEIAHEFLVNLTNIGPRVAGSYENEVLAVGVLVAALRGVARDAAPHHLLEIDVHSASGAFPLTFLDGMNNVYRDVQSVVARLSARGGRPEPPSRRTALLINCHYDTVPDSAGGSDDAAGCAVALETLRALASSPRPLAHDVLVLLNGAEENIMQASHAFVARHPWAPAARAFVNLEACGAGGREVLFQAGPHDPWIMEVYAASVPRPFASSLAQELFESGLIPADTDFRVFRDFGNLSGVDLAWSANGYVYHTRLDTAERAPPAVLQRTGDNVLALVHGLLDSGRLGSAPEHARQPVFFDVLGVGVVCVRASSAAVAAAALLLAVAARLHLHATDAKNKLYVTRGAWWRLVLGALVRQGAGALAGVAAAALAGAGMHALGARMAFYRSPWLLAPLYVAPGECSAAGRARPPARGADVSCRRGGRVLAGDAAAGARRLAARLVARAAGGRRDGGGLGAAAGAVRGEPAALGVPARAVGGRRGGGGAERRAGRERRRRAGRLGGGVRAARAADRLRGAGRAGHAGADDGARGPGRARRGGGRAGHDAGARGGLVAAAAAGQRAPAAAPGARAAGAARGHRGAGGADPAGRALQRRAPAPADGVPHEAHRPHEEHPGAALLDARPRRQLAAPARPVRAGAGGGHGHGGGGLRALGVLRRAVLPARAGVRAERARRARRRRAAHAPQRHAAIGSAQPEGGGAARVAGGPGALRAGAGAGAGRAPGALPRGRRRGRRPRPAGGAALARAPHLLLHAARRAPPEALAAAV